MSQKKKLHKNNALNFSTWVQSSYHNVAIIRPSFCNFLAKEKLLLLNVSTKRD